MKSKSFIVGIVLFLLEVIDIIILNSICLEIAAGTTSLLTILASMLLWIPAFVFIYISAVYLIRKLFCNC